MQAHKDDNYYYNQEEERPLTREFIPKEDHAKYMDARLKEVIFFAKMSFFSITLVILNYLFMMILPTFVSVLVSFIITYSVFEISSRLLNYNKHNNE
ncbi:hypothetical protein BG261_07945 [Floricoccus tropicus]|uniref:DUF3270 domain-containing protein n=1 Tax=Floricoccus tropicus TaxID=1859473 RepID=A0A1E8GIY6_9LACT|nr:DUF3270 family protein [Floricoccus tropicus]OFI48205.1 hypothetical protein BG261_07945 [Floricoccus tropicus]